MESQNTNDEAQTSQSSLKTEERTARKRKKNENPRNSEPGRKTTSWEIYNILLRKLVDQLIELGASKKIKIVTFQLWASYLRLLGVAFVSKEKRQLPALSLGFRNKDAKTLYGIKNLRKKLLTSKRKRSEIDLDSSTESSNATESEMQGVSKHKGRDSNDSSRTGAVITDEQRLNQTKRKKRILFNSSATEALRQLSKEIENGCGSSSDPPKVNAETKTQLKRLVHDRRFCNSKKSPFTPITIVTLISVVRVALQIVQDEIFLGDILRWICEGRISFNQYNELLSSHNLKIQNDLLNIKRQGFMLDIRNFTRSLELDRISTPNLFHLAERYCEELNLPNEFLQLVLKLMVDTKVAMDYSNYSFRVFPDYECRVMAFIIFVFKLIYSLDDFTELHYSEFVDLVNEIRSSESDDTATADVSKQFSWRKWMQFIQCRKAVLAKYDVCINSVSYNNGVDNPDIFLNYWFKVKSLYTSTDRAIKPELLSALSEECESLYRENFNDEDISIHFPVSLTPFKSYTEHLLVNNRKLLRRRTRKILSQDFSQDRMDFAGNHEWFKRTAQELGINIKVKKHDRYVDTAIYKNQKPTLLALSKTTIPRADIPVHVLIDEDEPPELSSSTEGVFPFEATVCEDEPEDVADSRIVILKSVPYWCLHECYKRMSVEEFEEMARNNLPNSFLWLLRECAAMLRASVRELYFELVFVEMTISQQHFLDKCTKRGSLKIAENEW